MKPQMNTDKHRYKNRKMRKKLFLKILYLSVFICVNLWLIFLSSCSTKPTDMRTLVPADSLVYLETNDLAAALQPIIDSKPFNEVAKSKPDFSPVKGVQLAVAVTGFETSEEKVNDEQSIGKIQPRFVAVADTHAFHFQAVGFAEQKLGSFVSKIYDGDASLEKTDKHGGKYFTWTAGDNRKAYALVIDSLIYFGNDETAIEKCLAVKRGEADSITKTGKVKSASQETLASGYVSTDGIAQIANIVGLKLASEASDEPEIQSAIAGIVPRLLRNSITESSWTATKTDEGIEDKYSILMPTDIASVFSETMAPSSVDAPELLDVLPQGGTTVTVYNFRDALVVWRSLLLMLQKQLPPSAEPLIPLFAAVLSQPYGIDDPERFIAASGPTIVTANDADDGQKSILVAPIINLDNLKASITSEIVVLKDAAQPNFENEILGVSYVNRRVHIGDANIVAGSVEKELRNPGELKPYLREYLSHTTAPITTYSSNNQIATQIKDIFNVPYQGEDDKAYSKTITETHFTKTGIERRTISDFGLIGSIIAQLAQD